MSSLRQQIGQMLIMGFAGTYIDNNSAIANWLSYDGLGGVLLFDYDLTKNLPGKNLVNQAQIRQLTQQIRDFAKQSSFGKDELYPFIAIDYEGGAVDRLRHITGCMPTKKPLELASLSEACFQAEVENMAETLKGLGFNLNFAPVVDLSIAQHDGIIGRLGRCFSTHPGEVALFAKKFVEIFANYGLSCCYKHFPGHGSAIGDTHLGFVDVTETFQFNELEPYSLLINQNELPVMIMTAHVINRKLDSSGLPATLSKSILTGILREKLGYNGVIISDDLQMQAISSHYSLEESLRLTISAGADMIIIANQLGQITAPEIIDIIENLVHANAIDAERIDQANQRILKLKQAHLALA